MADPRTITPDALEILVARDLRKAGLEVGHLRRRDLSRADDESGDYRLALATELTRPAPARLLIACHGRRDPLGEDLVDAMSARLAKVRGAAGGGSDAEPKGSGAGESTAAHAGGILVTTSAFTPAALAAAADHGIALVRVADARASFDASGWGPRGHYPMWLPEYVLELATRDAAGLPSHTMLQQGDAPQLLAAMHLTTKLPP